MSISIIRIISVLILMLWISSLPYADPTRAPGEVALGVFGEGSKQGVTSSHTGAMIYNYSFDLPSARGRPQPQLALNYNSSTRDREAGYGWGIDLPVIERKPLSGNPCFAEDDKTPIACGGRGQDGNLFSEERYTFNGQPLVFICRLGSQGFDEAECGNEPKPDWSYIQDWNSGIGWRYFRLQVEGQFARFYLSKDRKYWRVQLKGGEVL